MNDVLNQSTDSTCACGRGCLTGVGLLNMMLGFVAMGSPWMAGTVAVMMIGIMLLLSGFFELVHAFSIRGGKSGWVAFLGGALGIAGGTLILARPLYGLALLALVLAVYFVVDGIARIASAFQARPIPGWGFALFSGVVTLLLGLMIWRNWPLSGLWAVGILVGIRIFMAGLTMLFLSAGMTSANIQPSNERNDS